MASVLPTKFMRWLAAGAWSYGALLSVWVGGRLIISHGRINDSGWLMLLPLQAAAAFATLQLLRRRSFDGPRRLGWLLLFAAFIVDMLAILNWNYFFTFNPQPLGTFADVPYLVNYVLLAGACGAFFVSCGGSLVKPRVWLDGATLALGLLAGLTPFFISPLFAPEAAVSGAVPAALSYGIGILAVGTMALLLFMQVTDWRRERAIIGVVIAIGIGLLTDLGSIAANIRGYFRLANVDDLFSAWSYVIFVSAALAERDANPAGTTHMSRSVYSFVPVFGILVSLSLVLAAEASPSSLSRWAAAIVALGGASLLLVRHRDTEKLRTSEARLDTAVWGTDIGLWESTAAGECIFLSNWPQRFGIDANIGRDVFEQWKRRIHPDDLEAYVAPDQPCLQGDAEHYAIEYRIRHRNGDWHWIHERGKVTSRASDGTALTFAGVCIDIDAQKQTQTALRRVEDRYALAISAARLPVWEYDVTSDLVVGNVYWHQVLGRELSAEEAQQHREIWLSNIHPDDCVRHDHVFAGNAADSTGFYESEFRVRASSGEYKWILDRGRVIERAADGTPLKVVGVALDIDARRRMESDLRTSLHEKEVLLKEVHHRVKNNLQIISSLINMQLRRLQDSSSRGTLEQCQHRVQAIALIHEKLYLAKSLASVPLPDYIGSLARDILQVASVPTTNVSLEQKIAEIALPIDVAIPCGLILNELITNALKHAFPDGRQGTVRISVERLDASNLRLTVADNGVGLPVGFDIGRCRSMGLQLVNMLAAQLGAHLEFDVSGGASFQLTFPVEC